MIWYAVHVRAAYMRTVEVEFKLLRNAPPLWEREGDPPVHSYLNLDRGTREPTS